MVQKRFVTALVLTAFGLTACPIDVIDVPGQDGPYIEVSRTEAATGEPVQVDIKATYVSGTPYETVAKNIGLGACFMENTSIGSCRGVTIPEGAIELLENSELYGDIGDVVVPGRQSVTVSHRFTFTSNTPLTLTPVAFISFAYEAGDRYIDTEVVGPIVQFR